ncbi:MAG: LysM peptidoglycan-binding domain-containing protein [Geodermatophilaceae bacterium]
MRLTMRARRLLAGLVFLGCAALGVVAVDVATALAPFSTSTSYVAQEAPYIASGAEVGSSGLVPVAGTSVIVGPGDTLWSLAERVDPAADPREVIAAIMRLNDLESSALQTGQVLLLP